MSQITNALKKVQELRRKEQMEKAAEPAVPAAIPATVVEVPVPQTKKIENVEIEPTIMKKTVVSNEPVAQGPVLMGAASVTVKNSSMFYLATGTVVALIISTVTFVGTIVTESKQNRVLGLQSTIAIQDQKIHGLSLLINKNKKASSVQVSSMGLQLQNKMDALSSKLDDVSSSTKDNYENLKEAILDDKQEIDFLNNYTKKLNGQIQALSAEVVQANQPKEVNPSSGN